MCRMTFLVRDMAGRKEGVRARRHERVCLTKLRRPFVPTMMTTPSMVSALFCATGASSRHDEWSAVRPAVGVPTARYDSAARGACVLRSQASDDILTKLER